MSTALIMVGFTIFVLGLIALIRGRLGWARISTRKTAGLVMAAAFAVLLTGGALAPTPTPAATVRHVAPTTTPTSAPTSTPPTTTTSTPSPTSQTPVQAAPVQTTTTVLPTTQAVAQTTPVVPAPAVVPRQAATTPPPAPPASTIAPPAPPPDGGGSCGADSYLNSSGVCVPDPVAAPAAPPRATAHCRDGTYSFSQHRSGTCSGHGGVAAFL